MWSSLTGKYQDEIEVGWSGQVGMGSMREECYSSELPLDESLDFEIQDTNVTPKASLSLERDSI